MLIFDDSPQPTADGSEEHELHELRRFTPIMSIIWFANPLMKEEFNGHEAIYAADCFHQSGLD